MTMIHTRLWRSRVHLVTLLVTVFVLGALATPVAGVVLDKLVCNGCVDTGDIGKSAIKSGKIKNGAVHSQDLGDDAVTRRKIDDGAVTIEKLSVPVLLSARIDSNGNLITGSSGVASERLQKGRFRLTLPIDVTACVAAASNMLEKGGSMISGVTISGWIGESPNQIDFVVYAADAEMEVDSEISVIVTCPKVHRGP